jgi:4-aminobutyrate aminotransferase
MMTVKPMDSICSLTPMPSSDDTIGRDAAIMSPSYTRDFPLVVDRAHGMFLYSPEGMPYLDMAAGLATCSTGHTHPAVVRAIQEQAEQFIHVSSSDFYHAPQVQLAERLATLCPWMSNARVFFGCGGADATEAAIKMARYHTKRPIVLSFLRGFHGRSYGAMSLTASKPFQKKGFHPLMGGVLHAPYPYPLREKEGHLTEAQCIHYLEKLLTEHACAPDEIAAIIIEPIQGEGGYLPAPAGFLRYVHYFAKTHGIVMVMDEVQSGMMRTGKWWAHQHIEGIEPDVVLTAKGIASGMPLSAMIARVPLMDWPAGSHANTFGGNPISCQAALATLDVLTNEVQPTIIDRAQYLKNELLRLQQKYPDRLADVRGKGLMLGVELVTDAKTLAPDEALLHAVCQRLFYHHQIVAIGCGKSTLRLCPPLIIQRQHIRRFIMALDETLEHLLEYPYTFPSNEKSLASIIGTLMSRPTRDSSS